MTQAQEPKMQRPCPWCGGDASAHEVNPKDAPGWVHLTVVHRPGCLHRRAEEVLLLSAYDLEKWNRRADDAENEQLRAELAAQAQECRPLTDEQIASACFSFRRDFRRFDHANKAQLMDDARRWERAFAVEHGRSIEPTP